MAYKNKRTLIRVECTPILEPKTIAEQLRAIAGFEDLLGDYTTFKIGDTTNYKQGGVNTMSPDEMVYRYVKNENGLETRLDLTSQFYYVNLLGDNMPGDFSNYIGIIEKVTKILIDNDAFVKITGYAIRKDYVEMKNPPSPTDVDNGNRNFYLSQPENVHILYMTREVKDRKNKSVIAIKGDMKIRPQFDKGDRLFDVAFMNALTKAERENGLV